MKVATNLLQGSARLGLMVSFAALLGAPAPALADPILGSELSSFAVLGASTVTNVPNSVIDGNVGVATGTAITGFTTTSGLAVSDPQVADGLVESNTAVAGLAQTELTNAITNLALLGPGTVLSNPDLTGLDLVPGVYTVPAGTSNLTGTVTLDGQGNANAAWVFLFASTLITSSNSVVDVIDTGSGAGVYWDVGITATLGSFSTFEGNILASTMVGLDTGATIGCGRALANTAAVTLEMNTIGIGCSAETGGEGSNGFSGGLTVATGASGETPTFLPFEAVGSTSTAGAVSEPGSILLLATGLAGLAMAAQRRKAVVARG